MLCQNCGKREATTHIKRVVNGETSESHFCAECASSLGYKDVFSGWGLNFSDLLGGFLGENVSDQGVLTGGARCRKCGSSWNDIVRDGRLGCAECYRSFYDKLLPSLQRIHGRIRHTGKVSGSVGKHAPVQEKSEQEIREEKIESLKKQMDEAVAAQDFEQAAKLRDEIRTLEA
ncbi:MAG: UvrB/UvrC motif-containing protein [Acutalibacteraceae bacterium]